jgi:hypothetical protein
MDSRRVPGNRVHTKAVRVTSLSECKRLYGALAKVQLVSGTVRNVLQPVISGRKSTTIEASWELSCGIKVSGVSIHSVKAGNAPQGTPVSQYIQEEASKNLASPAEETEVSDEIDAPVNNLLCLSQAAESIENSDSAAQKILSHGYEWVEEPVLAPIGGSDCYRNWYVRGWDGTDICEGADTSGRAPLDYFFDMFPHKHLQVIVILTNEGLRQNELEPISIGELLKYFGILVLMTRFEFGPRRDLWTTTSSNKYIPAPCFGETGMSRRRFDNISEHIRFSDQRSSLHEEGSVRYRWSLVTDFIDSINEHRMKRMNPSELLCVDESISRWYGMGGSWIEKGLPHYVAIERKPEYGCELQTVACGSSGIMLRVRVVSTAEDEHLRAQEEGWSDIMHGGAVLLKLVENFAGSKRIVCADSYFSSVDTAEQLDMMGLKFIGVVKNATRKFPMGWLSTQPLAKRGDCLSLVHKGAGGDIKMMAAVWMDRERRYFVSTAGTTLNGALIYRSRWRQLENGVERVDLELSQPQFVEQYYSACSAVDRHNRCRQADLKLEQKVKTHDWSYRVNMSLLGICIVDSWLLYSGARGFRSHMTQREFYERLAEELIDNDYEKVSLRRRSSDAMAVSPYIPKSGRSIHLTPTKSKRSCKGVPTRYAQQGKCQVCKRKTTHICSECIDASIGKVVWLCHTKTLKCCFDEHLEKHHEM